MRLRFGNTFVGIEDRPIVATLDVNIRTVHVLTRRFGGFFIAGVCRQDLLLLIVD